MLDTELLSNEDFLNSSSTKKYKRSAKCKIKKEDRTDKEIECTISGEISYESTKKALEAKIKAEIKSISNKLRKLEKSQVKKQILSNS